MANVGNLPPGKEVIITIVYVMELEFNEDGQLRLQLLEQGYAPDGENSPSFPEATTSEAADNAKKIPAGLTIDIELDMSTNISQVFSPTHPAVTQITLNETSRKQALVSIPTTKEPLVQNFELYIQLEGAADLVTRVQANSKGERIAMVAFHPQLNDLEPLGEIIFLIDRSGSMMGPKLTRAKEAVQIFLRSLTSGVKFNIVSFGSSFSQLFPQSQLYSAETLATAAAAVKSMSANMGGTEILAPLNSIFKKPAEPKYPRQLFILTDGEVSNPNQCTDACRKAADSTRTFCFGIGSGASEQLCSGMAKAGNGNCVMIGNNDRIDDKVLEQLNIALLPAITNIVINWSGAAEKVSPSRQVTTFAGKTVVSFAWLKSGIADAVLPVRFTATAPLLDVDITKQVSLTRISEGTFLFSLAAKRLLDEFENGTSYAHDPDTGNLLTGWTAEKLKEAMVALSIESGVLCKHTSFVAVEERTDPTTGNLTLREVLKTKTGKLDMKNKHIGGLQFFSDGSASESDGEGLDDYGGDMVRNRGGSPRGSLSIHSTLAASLGGRRTLSEADEEENDDDWEDERAAPPLAQQAPPKKGGLNFNSSKSGDRNTKAPKPGAHAAAAGSARPGSVTPLAAPLAPPKTSDTVLAKMREVILKQTAEGSWTSADAVCLGISADAIKKALASASAADQSDLALLVLSTAVVCAYFEQKLSAEKTTWNLVVKKARAWIVKQNLASVKWADVAKQVVLSA